MNIRIFSNALILTFLICLLVSCSGQNQQSLDTISQLENSNNNLQTQIDSLHQQITQLQNLSNQKDTDLNEIDDNFKVERNCIIDNYMRYSDSTFEQGKIVVGFIDGTTESEAASIADEFGLSVDRLGANFNKHPWATFNVPSEKEIEWVCKIVSHEKVKDASLNFAVSAI